MIILGVGFRNHFGRTRYIYIYRDVYIYIHISIYIYMYIYIYISHCMIQVAGWPSTVIICVDFVSPICVNSLSWFRQKVVFGPMTFPNGLGMMKLQSGLCTQ